MANIADYARSPSGRAREEYEEEGNIEYVVKLIKERPELIAKYKDLQDFLIDIVKGESKPASQQKLRKLETTRKYAYYQIRIMFYWGCGFPKVNTSKSIYSIDAIRMLEEDELLAGNKISSETIRKELLKHKSHEDFKVAFARLGGGYYEYNLGLAVSLANTRRRPVNRRDFSEMLEVYNALTDQEKESFYMRAGAENSVKYWIKRQLKERGEKLDKKEWELHRERLVSEWLASEEN